VDVAALLSGLDAEQSAAVTVRAAPLAIVAAAGSGKTTVLTRRIAHRIATEAEVQAQHVLALTFTNQAANELQRRLRTLGMRERVEAGTFHAIALRLLRQRASDQNQPTISIASDRGRLMNEALRTANLSGEASLLLADIDWCRARRVAFADSTLAFKRAGRRASASPATLQSAADAYAAVKRRRGVVDFDDLLEQFLGLMRTDKLWAEGVRWRYRHLFVDEAQDLNPLQHALLEAIRGGRADLCLVGDPRQAIFGFNGADPQIMNSVEELYAGITILRLRRNYRCSPTIIAAARTVLERTGQTDDSVSSRHDGERVTMVESVNEHSESKTVMRLARDLVGTHRPWRTCAVLARTVAQLTEIAHVLADAGIPANVQGRRGRTTALGAALAEAYANRGPVELAAWVERVTADETADPLRARVAETADRYIAESPGIPFRAWVDLRAPFDDLEDSETIDAIDLLTFHAAKGREWPSVILVGAEVGLVPHSSAVTPAQRDEEARLFYVACTRARDQLAITWATSRNSRAVQQSPLVSGIDDSVETIALPPPRLNPRPAPDPIYAALVEWRATAARAAQVMPATICSDESLRAVAQARPATVEALAALTDLGPLAAARVAPRLLAALNRALAENPERAATSASRAPRASSR